MIESKEQDNSDQIKLVTGANSNARIFTMTIFATTYPLISRRGVVGRHFLAFLKTDLESSLPVLQDRPKTMEPK